METVWIIIPIGNHRVVTAGMDHVGDFERGIYVAAWTFGPHVNWRRWVEGGKLLIIAVVNLTNNEDVAAVTGADARFSPDVGGMCG
jgi:hypothetical protein